MPLSCRLSVSPCLSVAQLSFSMPGLENGCVMGNSGNSLCKSKPPRGKQHMLETLGQMLERSGHKTSHGSKGSSKD